MDRVAARVDEKSGERPLRPEELADRVVPSDPRIAPDGSRVAFSADPVGRNEEKKRSTLWLATADGSARKLTAGTANDRDPRWSPKGDRLLFISNRLAPDQDEDRLFLLPMDGGEALPLSDLKGAMSRPSWSPDGRHVAVLRRDPDSEAVKAKKKDRDDAVVVEEDPRFKRLWAIDAESGTSRCLTTGEREVRDYGWVPDGSALVAITTDAPETDAFYGEADLWSVPLAGALARRIARFVTCPSSPVAVESEAGTVVAVRADGGKADPADAVWVVPYGGGEPRRLTPPEAGSVEELVPLPGRRGQVGVRIVERTHGRLYAVDAVTGEVCSLTPPEIECGSVLGGVSFSQAGDRFAAIWSDSVTPEEVYLGTLGKTAKPLSSFGASFAGRLQPVEHVTWLSDDGVEIEGLLTYPTGYEEGVRYPLIVVVHGGPSWQWEDRVMLDWHDWAQMLASHGYAVLMPNPRGSTAYGVDFQRLLQDDVGGGESRDLITGALAMVERGIADRDRLGIGGWSWGGYLTAWTITQTDIFRAAVMGAGLANLVSDHGQGDIPSMNLLLYPGQPYHHLDAYWNTSPIRHVTAVKTPTLILHGDEDARVHPAQGMEYFRALKILGVPVRFVRYPREDHGIHERAHQIDLMERVLAWYGRWVKGESRSGGVEEPRSQEAAAD
jgi:dipeptidyl aminopeptidase/acylaminoacyl peptidase